jgi:hypothetical protein
VGLGAGVFMVCDRMADKIKMARTVKTNFLNMAKIFSPKDSLGETKDKKMRGLVWNEFY